MTNITSEDIFLGRKQEDFDLAEKLLVKHGKLNTKCVREMADALYGRMGIVECHEILKRVWSDMHVKRIEDENAKLRKIAADIHRALFSLDIDHCQACPRDTINGPCTKYMAFGSDECSIEEDMRELGIEVE